MSNYFAVNEVEVSAGLEGNEDAEKKEKEEDENEEGEDEEGENEEEEEEKKDTESKEMNESGMQRDEEEEEEKEEEEEDEEKEEEKEEEGQVEETDESRTQESEQKEGTGGSKASGEEEGAMEITEASGSSSVTDTMQSVVRCVLHGHYAVKTQCTMRMYVCGHWLWSQTHFCHRLESSSPTCDQPRWHLRYMPLQLVV